MKYITQICRIIVGVLFIISGFVKVIDPIGFGYKLEEYFSPQVFDIPFLMDLALPLAAFFAILEVVLGVFLLLGVLKRFTLISLLGIIVFFTFLTFYSAYYDKVTDCGCFGDALKLEPWESFYKDIFLLILIIILFAGAKYIRPVFKPLINKIIIGVAVLFSFYIANLGINHSPLIDFRAYAVGKNIPDQMKEAEELGLEKPEYRVIYTLKNKETGEEVEIDDKEYINDEKWWKQGTPWEIQTDLNKEVKVKDGYEPPIKGLEFNCDGEDKTELFFDAGKAVLIVIPFAEKLEEKQISELNALANELKKSHITVFAGVNNDIESLAVEACYVDQIALKTMSRSNPGIIVLKKGTVVAKYHYNDFPAVQEIISQF